MDNINFYKEWFLFCYELGDDNPYKNDENDEYEGTIESEEK